MQTLLQDVKHALRIHARSPGFAAAAILTLGLGIGAVTALYSVIHAVLLRQLPFRDADRLVWVWQRRGASDSDVFSIPDFLDYRENNLSLEQLAAFGGWNANLTGSGEAERLPGIRISADFFQVLGVEAIAGRTLQPDDDQPGSAHVVVLTYGLWQRRFGGDRGVVGRTILLNEEAYTVVGVLPPTFFFPQSIAQVGVPLEADSDPWRANRFSVNFLRGVGRLRPGVTREQAEGELTALARRLQQEYPKPNAQKTGLRLVKLQDEVVGGYRTALWSLFAAVGFVLLISCANLASLSLARATARRHEFSIRAALGGTRRRLVQQLLTESVLLGLAGGVLGAGLAFFGVRVLLAMSPADLPRASEIRMDPAALLLALVLSLFVGLLFGLAPAFSAGQLAGQMKEGGRGASDGPRAGRSRETLVALEVALSLVLLVGAGLLLKSLARLERVAPGFDPDHLLTLRLALPKSHYTQREAVASFYEKLLPRLEGLPGVRSAGVVNALPMSSVVAGVQFSIAGRGWQEAELPSSDYRMVSPDYLRTMRIPLLAGRNFTEADAATTAPVALISQALAQRYWPEQCPIGAHLAIDDVAHGLREVEIVGVAGAVRYWGLEREAPFEIYIPLRQVPQETIVWFLNNQFWVLRTEGNPLALADAARREIHAVDAGVAASSTKTMEQYLAVSLAQRKFNLELLLIFAGAALLLAAAGVYSVVCYSVAQRSAEIGVRVALGAQRGDVLRLVIVQGLRFAVWGALGGLAVAAGLARLAGGLLYSVGAADPPTYAGALLLLLLAAFAACLVPAIRACRMDPVAALRAE